MIPLKVVTSTSPLAVPVRDVGEDAGGIPVEETAGALSIPVVESTSATALKVSGLFLPSSLSGLAAWHSADYGVLNSVGPDVAATNGQTVRRWLDRSGNGRHLDQATLALQHTYGTTSGPNSMAGISASGTTSMTSTIPSVPQPYIQCIVFKRNETVATNVDLLRFGTQALGVYPGSDSSTGKWITSYGTARRFDAASNNTNWHYAAMFASGASSLATFDGTEYTYPNGSPGASPASGLNSSAMAMSCVVCELILVAGTQANATSLSKYLKRKYGL